MCRPKRKWPNAHSLVKPTAFSALPLAKIWFHRVLVSRVGLPDARWIQSVDQYHRAAKLNLLSMISRSAS